MHKIIFNELELQPDPEDRRMPLRIFLWCFLVFIIWLRLEFYYIILYLLLSVRFMFKRQIWVESPIEITLDDEKLTIYRERHLGREEYIEMRYDDTTRFVYRKESDRLSVSGNLYLRYTKYNKDGSLQDKPSNERTCNGGYTINMKHEDAYVILQEIEDNSPLRVAFENS